MNLISDLKSSIFGVDFRFFFNSFRNSRSNNKKNNLSKAGWIKSLWRFISYETYHELEWSQHYSAITKRK